MKTLKTFIAIILFILSLTSCTERPTTDNIQMNIKHNYCIDTIILNDFNDIDTLVDDNLAFLYIKLICNDSLANSFNDYSFWLLSENNSELNFENLTLRGVEFSSKNKKYLTLQTHILPSDTAINSVYRLVKNNSQNIIVLSKRKNNPTNDFKIWTQK